MSFLTAKAHIENLINARLLLMRNDRCFNGLTFDNIHDLQTALKTVDSPVSYALFITTYWTTINLLPPILDTAQRESLTIFLEKSKSLLNSSSEKLT